MSAKIRHFLSSASWVYKQQIIPIACRRYAPWVNIKSFKSRYGLISNLAFNFLLLIGCLISIDVHSQTASVTQESKTIKTYPYSDPNPLPSVAINKKVAPFYPYYVFDGYTDQGVDQKWKIVELENPYVKVLILPEVGGKVMGAIEKSTGKEFVYLNHVMKFRAIGIRGPWTSGGIEHNFGLDLGHAPWAAAPVDYVVSEHPDGSVSCTVGGLDLASRTQWRVNIVLPKDKAYFETKSLWYNPTPLHDAYLSWENAAYKATNDLQFYFPGTHHIGHDGTAHPWPIDKQGRDLSLYRNNDFGGHKSYHVMGTYTNWYGGYWHENDFGFGHWAPYSDAPGKKIWIWSLARDGAIWEDLLSDSDGQYIEAQSGVKFNQAGEKSGFHSPFNQLSLRPFYSETKTEYWFPVKATKGMVDASPEGTMNVVVHDDRIEIAISPNAMIVDSLKVKAGHKSIYTESLRLQPMQIYHKTIPLNPSEVKNKNISVSVGNDLLKYDTTPEKVIDRPVVTAVDQVHYSAERYFRQGEDENAMRNYNEARQNYQACLKEEPLHFGALTRMAELYYRSGKYEEGLRYAEKVLEIDTYHGGANFIYGVLLRQMGNLIKAEEAFSVAARTMEYRSGAYTQMAAILLQKQDYKNSEIYARKALDYNRSNLMAYEILGTSYRKRHKVSDAEKTFDKLLEIDPLNHYVRFEQYLLHSSSLTLNAFKKGIRNELPHETYLELAMEYVNQGLEQEAIKVLETAPPYPMVSYWLAYLYRNSSAEKSKMYVKHAEEASPELVFPFRLETIPVLIWAQDQFPSWKNLYYLGLIYWSKMDVEEAKDLFVKCEYTPDFAAYYLTRGILFQNDSTQNEYVISNFKKAKELNPKEWRTWHYLIDYDLGKEDFQQAATNARKAHALFPGNPIIGLDFAKALMNIEGYEKSAEVLHNIQILPQEGAREGHDIYELVYLSMALNQVEKEKYKEALKYLDESRKWPENLGAGKPHNPDTRLQDYIAAYCEAKMSHHSQSEKYYDQIATYSRDSDHWNGQNHLNNYLSIQVLREMGKNQEVQQLADKWKIHQDSLSNWNIAAGSSSPEFKWVWSKHQNKDIEAEKYKNKLLAERRLNRFTVFFRSINQMKIQQW